MRPGFLARGARQNVGVIVLSNLNIYLITNVGKARFMARFRFMGEFGQTQSGIMQGGIDIFVQERAS